MAFVKPLNLIYLSLIAGVAVNKAGLVMHIENTAGVAEVDVAAAGEAVFAVAYMTSEDPLYDPHITGHTVQFLTGVEIALVREGKVRVPVHQALGQGNIIPGDLVSVLNANTIGHVRRHVPTALPGGWNAATMVARLEEARSIVGVSYDAFTASATAGFINVLLRIVEVDFVS